MNGSDFLYLSTLVLNPTLFIYFPALLNILQVKISYQFINTICTQAYEAQKSKTRLQEAALIPSVRKIGCL